MTAAQYYRAGHDMGVSKKSLTLGIWGAIGAFAAYPLGEFIFVVQPAMRTPLGSHVATILGTALWTTVLAIGCTMALIMGQNRYLRRPLMDSQTALTGVVGGAISGAASGCLAETFFQYAQYAGNQNVLLVLVARLFAWAMFGCLIGLGMSFVIPNFGKLPGAASGTVGGSLGGVAFIVAGVLVAGVILAIGGADAAVGLGDSLGRCIGAVILGFALGYAIGLAEEATRTAWLQVTYGKSRESVRVSLGDQPVCVGSDSRRCAVWAQGARAVALKYCYVDGNVICDDITAETSYVVQPGDQQQVGHVTVLICTGAASPGVNSVPGGHAAPPPPRPAAPPPPPPARGVPQPARSQNAGPPANGAGMRSVPIETSTAKPPPPPPPPPQRY